MKQKLFVPFFLILLACITLSVFAAGWKGKDAFGLPRVKSAPSVQKPNFQQLDSKQPGIINGAVP